MNPEEQKEENNELPPHWNCRHKWTINGVEISGIVAVEYPLSLTQLQEELQKAIESEDYEKAAKIRDLITQKHNEKPQ